MTQLPWLEPSKSALKNYGLDTKVRWTDKKMMIPKSTHHSTLCLQGYNISEPKNYITWTCTWEKKVETSVKPQCLCCPPLSQSAKSNGTTHGERQVLYSGYPYQYKWQIEA